LNRLHDKLQGARGQEIPRPLAKKKATAGIARRSNGEGTLGNERHSVKVQAFIIRLSNLA